MVESEKIKHIFYEALLSILENGKLHARDHRSLFGIGINSRAAQHDILAQIKREDDEFSRSALLPSYLETKKFLDEMAYKYNGCSLFVPKTKSLLESIEGDLDETKHVRGEPKGLSGKKRTQKRNSSARIRSENNKNTNRRSVRTQGRSGKKRLSERGRWLPKQTVLSNGSLLDSSIKPERRPEITEA